MPNSPQMVLAYQGMMERLRNRSKPMPKDEALRVLADKSKIMVVGMGGPPGPARPGVWPFFNLAEDLIYDPTIKWKNDRFGFFMELWEDIIWACGIFPAADRKNLERIARKYKLRFANGVPQKWTPLAHAPNVPAISAARRLLHPKAKTMYPLPSPNLFTLENIDGAEPMTAKEDRSVVQMLAEKAKEKARTHYWPDVIGENES